MRPTISEYLTVGGTNANGQAVCVGHQLDVAASRPLWTTHKLWKYLFCSAILELMNANGFNLRHLLVLGDQRFFVEHACQVIMASPAFACIIKLHADIEAPNTRLLSG